MHTVDRTRHLPRRGARIGTRLLLLFALAVAVAVVPASSLGQGGISGAAFTTVNDAVDVTSGDPGPHCLNGNPAINCNIYTGKKYVWLNGGPVAASLEDGHYFFAVLSPGGQPNPNDDAADKANGDDPNLSDEFDDYTDRDFTITAATISYSGPHDFDSNKIRLLPYADTPNNGGVYILAICSLDRDGYPVNPRDCKYDAFKVKESETSPAADLAVLKDANSSFDRAFTWDITKAVDKTSVNLNHAGDTATFNYTVNVTHDGGTDGNWQVTGTITVTNPNEDDVELVDVTDTVNNGGICVLTGGSNDGVDETIPALASEDFSYTCTYSSQPDPLSGTNTAKAEWPDQDLTVDGQTVALKGNSATWDVSFSFEDPILIDDCVDVSDDLYGSLGTVCSDDASPTTFIYSLIFPAPAAPPLCVDHTNTAAFVTNTSGATDSASQTVRVCRVPPATGALTIGFWQNKNGQTIIKSYSGSYCQSLKTWLTQFNPFKDLTATSCGTSPSLKKGATPTGVVGYAYKVIKNAVCTSTSSTCNSMLKAQMLATALNVYFSDPSLGGNRIGAPAPIGGLEIDLTLVCTMIDGVGGTATCSGVYKDASAVFGGASHLSVMNMLLYMNSDGSAYGNGNPVASANGGSTWYLQIKAKQVCAKDAFDAINNRVAFLF